jgi:hypothetical protein
LKRERVRLEKKKSVISSKYAENGREQDEPCHTTVEDSIAVRCRRFS